MWIAGHVMIEKFSFDLLSCILNLAHTTALSLKIVQCGAMLIYLWTMLDLRSKLELKSESNDQIFQSDWFVIEIRIEIKIKI